MIEGMLLVDKPSGPTSHDVVQVARRKLGLRRIGHTGTLDPMAEGLLVLLIGAATKHQQALQGHDKSYRALVQLGAQTDTADAAGKPIRTMPVPALERGAVEQLLRSFEGTLEQTPPAYSAIKVQGRPAYWWTRRQQPVELASRTIRLASVRLDDLTAQTLTMTVECSAGTYLRVLAESVAERLGTVGHLAALTRLRIGAWRLEEAKPLAWIERASPAEIAQQLRPVAGELRR